MRSRSLTILSVAALLAGMQFWGRFDAAGLAAGLVVFAGPGGPSTHPMTAFVLRPPAPLAGGVRQD